MFGHDLRWSTDEQSALSISDKSGVIHRAWTEGRLGWPGGKSESRTMYRMQRPAPPPTAQHVSLIRIITTNPFRDRLKHCQYFRYYSTYFKNEQKRQHGLCMHCWSHRGPTCDQSIPEQWRWPVQMDVQQQYKVDARDRLSSTMPFAERIMIHLINHSNQELVDSFWFYHWGYRSINVKLREHRFWRVPKKSKTIESS